MYYLIFNPTAGAGRSIKVLESVEKRLKEKDIKYEIVTTEYKGHALELAKHAVGRGYAGIVSVGGDGTLLEVAEGLFGTRETLGVIPAGTGNDFRQAIGVPKDPELALQIILDGYSMSVDMGLLNKEKCFLNVAGTGFDVDVIKNTNRVRRFLTGSAAYYLGIIMSIFGYKNAKVEITVDGRTLERTILLIAIANGKCYAGGLQIGPDARVNDGLFNIVIINRLPKWRILIELPKLKRGDLKEMTTVEQFTCSYITINSDQCLRFNLDGEVYGQTPTAFSIQQNKLNVFCTNNEL